MRWIIAPNFDIVESSHRFLPTDAAEQISMRHLQRTTNQDVETTQSPASRIICNAWSAILQEVFFFLFITIRVNYAPIDYLGYVLLRITSVTSMGGLLLMGEEV